jgi:hypothetical protein
LNGRYRVDIVNDAIKAFIERVGSFNDESANPQKNKVGVVTWNTCAGGENVVNNPDSSDIFNAIVDSPYSNACPNNGGTLGNIDISETPDVTLLSSFKPGGYSSSLEGLVGSIDMLVRSTPYREKSVVIIISDGEDNRHNIVGKYNDGLCTVARDKFKTKTDSELDIFFIYVSDTPATHLVTCSGSDKVYYIDDVDDIFSKLELIWQELVGHNHKI